MNADFPTWLRATHLLNILFLSLLVRSGIQVLAALPKLYWNDHCTPGSEWLRLSRKPLPTDRAWTSLEEEVRVPSWLGLPGGHHLGLGRHWHFAAVLAWIATGLVYVVMLLVSEEWRRLVPTSWSIVPQAGRALAEYAAFELPSGGAPYNALQKLAYFAVVFLLAPLTIATGAAMSPAVHARFPRYTRLFGGKQGARSIHFLCLLAFLAFTAVHTVMVVVHGLPRELSIILLGNESQTTRALVVGTVALLILIVVHVAATLFSLRRPTAAQEQLGRVVAPVQRRLSRALTSRQHYGTAEVSPYFRVNGRPPADAAYRALADGGFAGWRLDVGGLVERPATFTLADLQAMPRQQQVTKHTCIQGWTAIAEWGGVPLGTLLADCGPSPDARFVVLRGMDDKALTGVASEPRDGRYYEALDLELAHHPQTLLAYEMNGKPLTVAHGAPLRLRVEVQLGFKMVKWIESIELVADLGRVGGGHGGWREDHVHYGQWAAI